MWTGTSLFPERATVLAGRVDVLYGFLGVIAVIFSTLIAGLIVYFAIAYRRRHPDDIGTPLATNVALEIAWTAVPALLAAVIFIWGAALFVAISRPPEDTIDVYVVGKQWMWKFQHLDGVREVDELHVPVGRPVRLLMTSEDVIHDVFVPAFRVKTDVIPGRYTSLWFEATRAGRFHLFCAEYCGTRHSEMTGQVIVMEPRAYQEWLTGGAAEGSLASSGEKLFADLACNTCHRADSGGRGPVLDDLFGKTVTLQGGERTVVDENYVRESILNPSVRVAAGYQPVMPTFQGVVTEEQLLQLVEYIKSLSVQTQPAAARPLPSAPVPGERTPSER